MSTSLSQSATLPVLRESNENCDNIESDYADYTDDDDESGLEWEANAERATANESPEAKEEDSNKNATFMARILGPSSNKAGLQSTDKDMITRVIYEASKVRMLWVSLARRWLLVANYYAFCRERPFLKTKSEKTRSYVKE